MQRNELQLMRIDVTGVDEALSFLGATAGIVRVHQSALAVHELIQIAAGTREALPEVVGRHLQDFATNGVARSEDFPEREDQSLLAVQTEQHPGCARDFGLLDENRHVHRNALRIRQVEIGRLVDRVGVAGKRQRLHLPASPLHVQHVVGRNAVEPGAELTVALKSAEPGDGFDEDFLSHFLGILRMKNHPQGDVVNPCLMPKDQFF